MGRRRGRRGRDCSARGGRMRGARWLAASVALVAVLALAACGARGAGQGAGGFRVGLVTDVGKIDDRSFNQSVWEGVQQAQREASGIMETKYVEATDPKRSEERRVGNEGRCRW